MSVVLPYPSRSEVTADWTDEVWAEKVSALTGWQITPNTLAQLNSDEVTPEILRAWADLTAALRDRYPDAQIGSTKVTVPLTDEELRDNAAAAEQSRVYDLRRKEAEADEAKSK